MIIYTVCYGGLVTQNNNTTAKQNKIKQMIANFEAPHDSKSETMTVNLKTTAKTNMTTKLKRQQKTNKSMTAKNT